MVISLSSNISGLKAQRALSGALNHQSTLFQRLSSGSRINSASDDPASLAVSEGLRVTSRINEKAVRNLNDGISLLNVTEGAVTQLKTVVTRITELAEQSANGTFSNTQRQALDREAQALAKEYSRIVSTTSFNNVNIFTQTTPLQLQAGTSFIEFRPPSLVGVQSNGTVGGASILSGNGTGTFAAGRSFSSSSMIFTLGVADFNGDGRLDLAGEEGMHLGNGDGTFKAKTNYGQDGAVTIGDVNNDGRADIILTQDEGGTALDGIRVLRSNGDGTFAMSIRYNVGGDISDATIADFNGDGNKDIVTSNYNDDTISVIFGNGDGSFTARSTYRIAFAAEITSADLNGDGHLDIFGGNHELQVLYGNGNGTFKAPVTAFSPGANQIFKYAAGDMNGDGILDLVGSNFGTPSRLHVILGNGDGTFKSAITSPLLNGGSVGSTAVSLVDMNSDGRLDVFTSQDDAVVLYLGNGNGTFSVSTSLSLGSGANIGHLEFGDINGDGTLDILAPVWGQGKFYSFLGTPSMGGGGGASSSVNYSSISIDVSTQSSARSTLTTMGSALDSLNDFAGRLGAFQSRLDSAIRTLHTSIRETTAADSRIRDLDIASATAELASSSIRASAASAVLAQANQQPRIALRLLGI